MIRNKILLKAIALLMVACMALSMTAMAADTSKGLTCIVVTIEDDEGTTSDQPYLVKLRGESSRYLTDESPLLAEVVAIINAFYPQERPEVLPANTLWDFQSPAMQRIMDEGLAAYRTGSDETWQAYVDKYFEDVEPTGGDPELKAILRDKNSTIGDIIPNVVHKISLLNTVEGDRKIGVTYTVTITRYAGEGYDPDNPGNDPDLDVPVLNKVDHVAYIIGYSDGTVRPQNNISRAEVATIFFRLLTPQSRAKYWSTENDYTDVISTNWFNNAVSTLSNAGIITGYEDGTFRPNEPITRAEFATIASRFSNVIYRGESSFTDVPTTHWASKYVALAENLGWITGYPDGSFQPSKNITRAEAMTLINRVLERSVEEENMLADMVQWIDNDSSAWYYEAVQEATNSHDYTFTDKKVEGQKFFYESWTKILEVPDWAALEKTWSDGSM